MAETTGSEGRGKKSAGRRARPAPGNGKAKAKKPDAKKTIGRRGPKAQSARPEAPAATPRAASAGGADWNEIAEKASARLDGAAQKAGDAARKATVEARKMAVDLSEGFDKAFGKLRVEAEHMMKKGAHTRVRIKFRGKQVTPDLPVAVVAGVELASLWWAGPLRLLLAHVVGKSVLEVEFVNDAQAHVAAGRTHLSSGDIDDALKEFGRALEMDAKSAGAHLGRGIAFKLQRQKDAARREFLLAEQFDPRGDEGREARRHLDNLGS